MGILVEISVVRRMLTYMVNKLREIHHSIIRAMALEVIVDYLVTIHFGENIHNKLSFQHRSEFELIL